MKERSERGSFKSLKELLERVSSQHLNLRMVESLIKAGAIDRLGSSRARMMAEVPLQIQAAARVQQERDLGQASLFAELDAAAGGNATGAGRKGKRRDRGAGMVRKRQIGF